MFMNKSLYAKETKIVSEMLYQLRVLNNFRQCDLAKLLKVPQSFISKIESGERRLDIVELRTILLLLDSNLNEFTRELEKRIDES